MTVITAPLYEKIINKEAEVGIIGLGYVGLPTACHKAQEGFHVTGFDVSSEKVDHILAGHSYIKDVPSSELEKLVEAGKVTATTELSRLEEMDVVLICVPTPIDEHKNPDLSFVDSASDMIQAYASPGTLIILESTTYPGTTQDYLVKKLQQKGYVIGEDVFVAYSPERVDPGNRHYNLENTPKVVGGVTPNCTKHAAAFVGHTAHPVSSVEVAEMSKAYENSFRYINMAFTNEMATICRDMNIDIWEVINASGSKPYGFMPFTPNVGVGGHCIPVDPYYITHKAKEVGRRTRMIELAGELNDEMTDYTYHRIMDILNEEGKALKTSFVLVMGVAYKEDISDVRESPVLPLLDKLHGHAHSVGVMDPYVSTFSYKNKEYSSLPYDPTLIEKADIVVLATPHALFPLSFIAESGTTILDAKNAFGKQGIRLPSIHTL